MNSTDKALVMGIAAISTLVTLRYGWTEEKLEFMGLDSKNTKRFIAGIAVISIGVLVVSAFKKPNSSPA